MTEPTTSADERSIDDEAGRSDDATPDGTAGDGGESGPPAGERPWWRRVDRSVLVVTGIVALGFVIMLRGVLSGVTGDERAGLPPLIEAVSPVPEAVQVLSQTNVVVDLAADYTGVLVIDDQRIETVAVDEIGSIAVEPGAQVDLPPVTIYEPGNATLTFTPTENAVVQEFAEGRHQVEVIYWRVDEGPERARSFTWTFDVV